MLAISATYLHISIHIPKSSVYYNYRQANLIHDLFFEVIYAPSCSTLPILLIPGDASLEELCRFNNVKSLKLFVYVVGKVRNYHELPNVLSACFQGGIIQMIITFSLRMHG